MEQSLSSLPILASILALDTSTDACSVALMVGSDIYHRFEIAPQQHTQLILSMVDSVLKEAGIPLTEINALAFGRGPGSFTGGRIGAAVVQGLSVGINKPIVPVSTLRAMAEKSYREYSHKNVFACLDARLDAVYWGLFQYDDNNLIMQACSEEKLSQKTLIELPEGNWFHETGYPDALDIAAIARVEFALGHVVHAKDALPIYINPIYK